MKMQGLRILAEELVERGFLLETRAPVTRRIGREIEISVGNTLPLEGDIICEENSTTHYLECVRQDRLSWLLFDGSIVQVSYRLRGEVVTFHRYCYIPAPFNIDLRTNLGPDLSEWIEGVSSADPFNTARRSSLRFEFDPATQRDRHAAAHLHLNSPQCRIPMRGPLSVREFMSFLVRFLYPNAFAPGLIGEATFEYDSTITDLEERSFHLNWRRLIPGWEA
jgi:hypothetical protein